MKKVKYNGAVSRGKKQADETQRGLLSAGLYVIDVLVIFVRFLLYKENLCTLVFSKSAIIKRKRKSKAVVSIGELKLMSKRCIKCANVFV